MSAQMVSASELARTLGVSPTAVAKARNAGRISEIDGKFDLAVARIQWEANRKRRRMDRPEVSEPPSGVAPEEAADYWVSKARREAAEAEMAELKASEIRGDLVRKAVVERELVSKVVALRESLEVLADRLSAVMAAETDAQVCRKMLRDEHRQALQSFNEIRIGIGDGLA